MKSTCADLKALFGHLPKRRRAAGVSCHRDGNHAVRHHGRAGARVRLFTSTSVKKETQYV